MISSTVSHSFRDHGCKDSGLTTCLSAVQVSVPDLAPAVTCRAWESASGFVRLGPAWPMWCFVAPSSSSLSRWKWDRRRAFVSAVMAIMWGAAIRLVCCQRIKSGLMSSE